MPKVGITISYKIVNMTFLSQLQQFRDATMARMPQSIIKSFEKGLKEIEHNQLKEKSLQVGDMIPDFKLTDIQGNHLQLDDIHSNDFLLLNFI